MESTISKFEAERAELDSLLGSESFGRCNNLAKMLAFVCEKYFQGSMDDVREYDIAVHALGRPKDFDPQIDTIVRVTAHALRKRLEQYYRTDGAEHPVHIYLPAGRYIPKFVRAAETETVKLPLGPRIDATFAAEHDSHAPVGLSTPKVSAATTEFPREIPGTQGSARVKESHDGNERVQPVLAMAHPAENRRFRFWMLLGLGALSLCALGAAISYVHIRARNLEGQDQSQATILPAASVPGNTVRALVGEGRAPYVDRAGQTWSSDTSCTGGSTFSVPARPIRGTLDTQLFLGGRQGLFHCAFALPAGTYELHLLFAETTSVEETGRTVIFSLNGAPSNRLDVVDDAGGNDVETEKVFSDVQPQQDGKVHLDFTSSDSYLNAIEILPGTPNRMLPVRIYAGETPYHDSEGNIWQPNRYFFGGRESHYQVVDAMNIPDGGLFTSQWIGHFRYVIPVAPGEKYTVKLYFRESWFGGQDGGGAVVGSRVFDVWCNGNVVLKNFDILQEAGSAPVTKTFSRIEPTAQGKIELYFVPVVNYPSLNAIEVLAE